MRRPSCTTKAAFRDFRPSHAASPSGRSNESDQSEDTVALFILAFASSAVRAPQEKGASAAVEYQTTVNYRRAAPRPFGLSARRPGRKW